MPKIVIESMTVETRIVDVTDVTYAALSRRNFDPNTKEGREEIEQYRQLREEIITATLRKPTNERGTAHSIQDIYGNSIDIG